MKCIHSELISKINLINIFINNFEESSGNDTSVSLIDF